MKDIVQIEMNSSDRESTPQKINGVAATLQYRDIKIQIHNDIDKYILYIILKELKTNAR
ncbi:Hypothetical protein ADU72_2111 [Pediococcus damnosus]|uniref:Uncharacterized protein n=1 Tax=Pediococcus damnosus TaxID=51663 RepID=A0ABM6A6U7_9LACO|nr:hypothetical protein [Pediococcus damnosus]AMV68032.1 Hypothetical protein ADU72_2111 [Pediococcus damnosus]GEA93858.1 hypothetical protein PDA01_17510 [Pediococcus damnosus]